MQRRPINIKKDLPAITDFFRAVREAVHPGAAFHIGDFIFRVFLPSNRTDIERDICIWTDENGKIQGLVFFLICEANPEYFFLPGNESLLALMDEWASKRAAENGITVLETGCLDRDEKKLAALKRSGYTRLPEDYLFHELSLNELEGIPRLPDNYRYLANDSDPPVITSHQYEKQSFDKFRSAPFYTRDLHVRITDSSGTVVAGALAWIDGMEALLEPVGCISAHRRRGLAKIAVLTALHRASDMGATRAYVKTDEANTAARALYESIGFKHTAIDRGFARNV